LGLAFVRGIARGTAADGGRFACGNCVFGPVCPFGFGYPPLPLAFAILVSCRWRTRLRPDACYPFRAVCAALCGLRFVAVAIAQPSLVPARCNTATGCRFR